MSNITLRTTVERVEITGGGYNTIDIEIDGLDTDEVLNELSTQDVIDHYGADDLLDTIGEEAARRYFNIAENEQ